MAPDLVLDLGIAPEGALTRISAAINRRPKRSFGVFKLENEFVGVVTHDGFEIWERRQRAVHAVGRVRPRHRGTRIDLRFVLPAHTRALIAVFFGLYVLVAVGIAIRPPETAVTADELLVAIAGAAVLALVFAASARRQRADLRAFLERLFGDVPRI